MKKLTGLIILLLVQSLSFGQVNIHIQNGGRAATQEWVKVYLETLLNKIEAPTDTTGTSTPTPVCSGPNIQSITAPSQTGLTFTWSGINVPDIVWTVSDASGVLRTGSISSSSSTRSITFNSIGYGTFSFAVKGIGCPTTPTPVSFTLTAPPVVVSNGRRIYMNTTGYGFSTSDPYGIDEEWRKRIDQFNNLSYNGVSFSGINGVRLCVRWADYEPTEGVYNDAKILAALNYCKARNLKLAICFWSIRKTGDNFVPDSEKATGSNGQISIIEFDKYSIAPYSTAGKQKLKAVVKHLAQLLAQYPNDTDYISLGYGETEEFYNPMLRAYDPQRNLALAGYSPVDRVAWASYIAGKGIAGLAPPVSPNANDAWATGDYWNSGNNKYWYEFITDGLASIHASFRDGVHEGGGKVCGFYADAGGAQSAWYMTYRLNKIFEGSDIAYSSEGGNRYDLANKLMSADVNLGTFPNAEPAIEFDPEDLSTDGSTNYGNPTDSGHLLEYGSSFFKRGGKVIHFAMGFSYGENGTNNIVSLAPALWTLQNDYVKSTTIPGITPGPTLSFAITSFSGDQGYRGLWSSNGGGTNKQVKIKLLSQPLSNTPSTSFTMSSAFIPEAKGIRVFLPSGYTANKQYPVIYMMDGQDLESGWNAPATLQSLINSSQAKEAIIVGVNSGAYRFREYQPSAVWHNLTQGTRDLMTAEYNGGPLGDEFLNFLILELKPKIDAEYSVLSDQQNTYIGGSSMGGLIAIYAVCKYPNVFRGNLSLSTHWLGSLIHRETEWPVKMKEYINSNTPASSTHRLYFDRGTEDLDNYYGPLQLPIDAIFQTAGYNSANYRSLIFDGKGHNVAAWAERFNVPLKFQLAP